MGVFVIFLSIQKLAFLIKFLFWSHLLGHGSPLIFVPYKYIFFNIKRVTFSQYPRYDAIMWQLLMKLPEKSTYLVHNGLNFGKIIFSHGFTQPLKRTTPAFLASTRLVFSWYPNRSMCQKGSIVCTLPWNAVNPGGNVPS